MDGHLAIALYMCGYSSALFCSRNETKSHVPSGVFRKIVTSPLTN